MHPIKRHILAYGKAVKKAIDNPRGRGDFWLGRMTANFEAIQSLLFSQDYQPQLDAYLAAVHEQADLLRDIKWSDGLLDSIADMEWSVMAGPYSIQQVHESFEELRRMTPALIKDSKTLKEIIPRNVDELFRKLAQLHNSYISTIANVRRQSRKAKKELKDQLWEAASDITFGGVLVVMNATLPAPAYQSVVNGGYQIYKGLRRIA